MNNLIERYIFAVTEQVPDSQRADISKELKATIEDMVTSRTENGEDVDSAIRNTLLDLGNPVLLAQEYTNAKQHLISPKWFAIYKAILVTVLKYSLPIILLISVLTGLQTSSTIGNIVVSAGGSTASAAIWISFWVTAFFAAMERSDAEVPAEFITEWTPDSLPENPSNRQVRISEALVEVIVSVIGLAFFVHLINLDLFNYAQFYPIWVVTIILIVAQLIRQALTLVIGNWTKPLLIIEIISNVGLTLMAIVIASTPNIISPGFVATLEAHGINNPLEFINIIIYVAVAAVVLTSIWEVINTVKLYFRYKQTIAIK